MPATVQGFLECSVLGIADPRAGAIGAVKNSTLTRSVSEGKLSPSLTLRASVSQRCTLVAFLTSWLVAYSLGVNAHMVKELFTPSR